MVRERGSDALSRASGLICIIPTAQKKAIPGAGFVQFLSMVKVTPRFGKLKYTEIPVPNLFESPDTI